MQRYVLEVMYDGTCFHGSQVQGEIPTVQLAVNYALSTLLREHIISFGASRTDEGVHALCNFYHFDTDVELKPDFLYKCNAILPHGVAAKAVYIATKPDFNARFDAVLRRYRYKVYSVKNPFLVNRALYYPYGMEFGTLQQTAVVIKEYTQFESFAKRNTQSKTFNCTIHESYWERVGDELHYIVAANRFLRGMVRGLVATQLRVAKDTDSVGAMRRILDAQDCTKAFFNVAGHGLYLEAIVYPNGNMKILYKL